MLSDFSLLLEQLERLFLEAKIPVQSAESILGYRQEYFWIVLDDQKNLESANDG